MPIAAWMRSSCGGQGRAPSYPDAERLAAVGSACTGDTRADVARFAVFESVLPPALMSDQPFRQALSTAYDRLATPNAAITPELSS